MTDPKVDALILPTAISELETCLGGRDGMDCWTQLRARYVRVVLDAVAASDAWAGLRDGICDQEHRARVKAESERDAALAIASAARREERARTRLDTIEDVRALIHNIIEKRLPPPQNCTPEGLAKHTVLRDLLQDILRLQGSYCIESEAT